MQLFTLTTAVVVLGSLSVSRAAAQLGSNYCTPNPNSTGMSASMSASGTTLVVLNDLTLHCTSVPPTSFGCFLTSRYQGFTPLAFGSAGNLCLAAPLGLYSSAVQAASAGGAVSMRADLTLVPTATVSVMPGDTFNFQYWHRDVVSGGGATSNFSDGLEVLFTAVPNVPGMVPIPAGTFLMGSSAPNSWPYHNFHHTQPVHQVTISYAFWMGQYEVTQAEYVALMTVNPSTFPGPSLPVDGVTWTWARAYCAALTGQQSSLGAVPPGYEYRLPTEAEWEYACRAGSTTEFHYGPDLYCGQARFSYSQHSSSSCNVNGTVPVGSYAPNRFGLYDMHGNVIEWCLDRYAPYSSAAVTDPFVTGPGHLYRIARGGAYEVSSNQCRSAQRFQQDEPFSYRGFGFRVVLAPALVP